MELTQDELTQIITQAVAAGVKEYKRQEKAERQQRDRYTDTFNLMKSYRAALFSTKQAPADGGQLLQQAKLKANRLKTEIAVEHINAAMQQIEADKAKDGRQHEYEAFKLYFLEGRTYQYIAEALNTGEATPRRWVTAIVQELSVMLWGIDDTII
ncbi:hypothetical protein D6855_03630 [Butyrivibrio sp. CB08]|uniref:hypothetical protein n=1 Tax=Butyrivibrio sp. CB08 TaxID=2364879 RepID=UPI000EAA9B3D|nr:hypothetical protein [Butyrivibrio sp. CB08]RKM60998.1 hypothetical protein D6855_03630 [Butyrivibrio sp. CB08]